MLDELWSRENLWWAWKKVREHYRTSDTWYDEVQLNAFELNIEDELRCLARSLRQERHQLTPLKLLPQPKKPSEDGAPRSRQAFWVAVRDQVAWLAVLNLVGPEVDRLMPSWSYGNRLYRPVWYEQEADLAQLRVGPYRNGKGLLYRKFQHSWPLYRRHIVLSAAKMASPRLRRTIALGEREQKILDQEETLESKYRLAYLRDDFWKAPTDRVFWAGVDLAKFYPTLRINLALDSIIRSSPAAHAIGRSLLDQLSSFSVDLGGWSQDFLDELDIRAETFDRIPTGLMASGFLANAAMLDIDTWVASEARQKQVAHFRYVDDHVFLARSFDDLTNWISDYEKKINQVLCCQVNPEKIEPPELRSLYMDSSRRDGVDTRKRAETACTIDPAFPSPLFTKTLEKVSELAAITFDFLDDGSQKQALNDLEHLLLAPLPEEELPEATRVAFAATMLARNFPRQNNRLTSAEFAKTEVESPIAKVVVRAADMSSLSGQDERARKRIFQSLLKALARHPEKLRLWDSLLGGRHSHICRGSNSTMAPSGTSLLSHKSARHRRSIGFLALHYGVHACRACVTRRTLS